jgi:ribonuclease E
LAIATPAEANATAQEILKNDTVESSPPVENPAPAEAASIAAQAAPETTPEARQEIELPTPAPAAAPVATVEPPKPAPARPAVGNTGSLFFTADADTPSSVTRHLFEPMPAPQPAAVVEKHEERDLPMLAENDETAGEEKDQGSERSA